MTSEVLATCIIPTCGKSKVLSSLLEELERQSQNCPKLYEVIVVGDNITPPVTFTSAKCVMSRGVGGVSSTRNYGAKLATTTWLVFLDDDVIPDASWSNVLEQFLKTTNCDLAGGRLDISPPEYQDLLPKKYRYLLGEKSGLNSHLGKFDYIAGAQLLIRKSVYEELGGFCETKGHKDGKLSLNEDVMLQAEYRKKYDKQILYLDGLRCNHYVRPEQTHPDYIISRLQAQGKADACLDKDYYPVRVLIKSIYYSLLGLINHKIDRSLSLNSCNWYRRQSYLTPPINKFMNKPLVSVIIPNYNYDAFLTEAIDSVLAQAYTPIEVIVVDDGSTDNSRNIIMSYGKKIIPIYKNQGGEASALNAGFLASSGELICLLDSDDVWLSNKVEQIVNIASHHPEAVLIYHQVQPVDINKNYIDDPEPSFMLSGWLQNRVAHSGGWWHFPGSSGLTFKRCFIEKVTPIPELDYCIAADAYLADLAPFCGKVIALKQVLAFYRLHDKNNYWTTAVDSKKEVLRSRVKSYENRVLNLNESLQKLGLTQRVSLTDQYTYRKYKYLLGEDNIIGLLLTALKFPVEPLPRRIKNVTELLLKHFSIFK